ncbi:MAG: DNA-directed RNA polymerase [Candidatus Thermoplasmatota archaeon]|nr:DNA-directed RNA polymerase [Candidatus Thermoplasmatota archaeon]
MYAMKKAEGVVRVPPERLGEDMGEVVKSLAQTQFEGHFDEDKSLVVLAKNIETVGPGRVVHGDGAVYQTVRYDALIFKPAVQEVVQGFVCDVLKFGAFIRFGPLDALVHISQLMDDHVDADVDNKRLIGKESKKDLRINDEVRARIVTISINERNPRESKIGLTMRQPGLGKIEWLEDEREEAS